MKVNCCQGISRGRDRRTGYEEVTGETADISEWIDFGIYDLFYWMDRLQYTW